MSIWPRRTRHQAGEGKIGLVLGLIVLIGTIYFLKLWMPPRLQRAELEEFIEQKTRLYVVQQISYDQLMNEIAAQAKAERMPITQETLIVDDTEQKVRIQIKYDVVQRLVGGKEWVQHHEINVEVPRI